MGNKVCVLNCYKVPPIYRLDHHRRAYLASARVLMSHYLWGAYRTWLQTWCRCNEHWMLLWFHLVRCWWETKSTQRDGSLTKIASRTGWYSCTSWCQTRFLSWTTWPEKPRSHWCTQYFGECGRRLKSKGPFTRREGNPSGRVTLLGGSKDSPTLHV